MSSFQKKAFARYQAQALQESDYMVKQIMMKHDKAKREAKKEDEASMNTMHTDEEEDDMNKELGEEKKKHEDRMNNNNNNDDDDMNEDLGETAGEEDCHHDGCRKSRKLGDSQGAGATAIEAEAQQVAAGREPFSSEPVTDEDGDQHFVMTGKNRRVELKDAAYGKSESSVERQEARIAEKTERERQAINLYESIDEKKRVADKNREKRVADMSRYVAKKLAEHHLMRDSKGRVVPNV